MKKKLEAELISIAHRILKLKNKSELVQLHQEVQKLYEKLSVLKFLEEQFDEVRPTIGRAEVEAKLETFSEEKAQSVEIPSEPLRLTDEFTPIAVFMPEEVTEDRSFEDEEIDVKVEDQEEEPNSPEPEIERQPAPEVEMPHVIEIDEKQETEEAEEEPETEPEPEEDKTVIRHVLPMEEIEEEDTEVEEVKEEEPVQEEVKTAPKEISFADLLGHDFSEPVFERVEDIKSNTVETPVFEKSPVDFKAEPVIPKEFFEEEPYFKVDMPKVDPHDTHHKAITFGLNDKIGFEKHLFGGSSEDMNRVVSQLGSFNTFEDAKEFINDMVKPDYNNWEGKEDYEQRFMEIIEKKFN